jgi:hypothetical protein
VRSKKQKYRISEASHRVDQEWCDFISGRSNATLYHHPSWLKVLENETRQEVMRLICRDEDERLVGVFPLQYTKGFPLGLGGFLAGKRLSSLPRTPVGGPIAINSIIEEMLIKRAIEVAGKHNGRFIQIKSYDRTLSEKMNYLSRIFWRNTYVVKIPPTPAEIRFGTSDKHSAIKRAVNKATKAGIVTRYTECESDLVKWYDLYAETMRFHSVPARSIVFFKSVLKNLMSSGLAKLMLAEVDKNGGTQIISGNLLFCYNKSVVYAFNGSRRKYLGLRANDLLHWRAIHDSQNEGFEYYDLGEAAEDHIGLASYKKKWASEKNSLYHFYYPEPKLISPRSGGAKKSTELGRRLWRCLPLKITALMGREICKRL